MTAACRVLLQIDTALPLVYYVAAGKVRSNEGAVVLTVLMCLVSDDDDQPTSHSISTNR